MVEDIGEAEVEKINLRGMDKLVEAEKAKIVEQPFQPKVFIRIFKKEKSIKKFLNLFFLI